MAKLIRVEKNPRGLSYLDTYYFECSDCGKEYFRHANNKRINPYCGTCQRKHDNEKQKERLKTKRNQSTIEELKKIKAEITACTQQEEGEVPACINYGIKLSTEIVEKHISELKGE